MCRTLEVSKSGFYAWQKRPESNRSKERKALSEKIKTIHENSRKTYGSVRVHAVLLEENESSSRPRVAGIMRELGLQGKRKGTVKQKTTDSKHSHAIAENTLESKVVLDALEMARSSRNPLPGLLHHSDRGVQYSAGAHRLALERFGAISSMSRNGNCWDNAVAESAFATLKCELDLEHAIGSRAETRAIVFEWIEVWYNRERRHSSLGFLAPAVFEAKHLTLF
jgi:putative transposase